MLDFGFNLSVTYNSFNSFKSPNLVVIIISENPESQFLHPKLSWETSAELFTLAFP